MDDAIKAMYLKMLMDTATDDELSTIDNFMKSHPQAADQLKEYASQELSKVKDYDLTDSKKKWIQHSSAGARIVKINAWKKWATAAAILLLIPFSWLLFHRLSSSEWIEYAAHNKLGFETITLEDGTVVQLRDGSVLYVAENFGKGSDRKVKLMGTAFFDVHRDTAHPFTIGTSKANVMVLGTSFNVEADSSETTVKVKTGVVKVSGINHRKEVTLYKGQAAISSDKGLTSFTVRDSNVDAWYTGHFVFEGESLEQVVADLNTFYRPGLALAEGLDNKCKFTATFSKVPIDEVVEVIRLSCKLDVEREKGRFILK